MATTAAAAPADDTFAGVAQSLTGKRWVARSVEPRLAMALAQVLGVPEVVGRVLAGRGVDADRAAAFLNPTLRHLLPDPSTIRDMDEGADRLATAIVDGQKIAVFADYDADGATSAALLCRFLAAVGRPVRLYVPDRLSEGYGPTTDALLALRREGIEVVVTVDCGTTAYEPLAAASAAALDVIVVDHHAAEARLPHAAAVINPNRLDDDSGQGHLAAVGVTFLLIVATNRCLRRRGFYVAGHEPDLRQWLDLVALGTVCDMVPLIGVNRALVAQGLKVMAGWSNQGLKALARIAGLARPPQAYHAGFVFGPRINAGGRVGEAGLGARLLATDDVDEAAQLARRLEEANQARREIEAEVLRRALTQVATAAASPVVVAAGEDWHPGVVGIVASRLVERFQRPALVVGLNNGTGVGSGRSIPGVDLGAAVIAARNAGLLTRGGGHAMAAGFSLPRDGIDAFREFLVDHLAEAVATAGRVPTLGFDGTLAVAGVSAHLAATLAQVGPYGVGNPEPRFAVVRASVARVAVDRGRNVRCVLTDESGGRVDAVAFRAGDTALGQALVSNGGAPFHVAGRLRHDERRGLGKAELLIDDVAAAFAA